MRIGLYRSGHHKPKLTNSFFEPQTDNFKNEQYKTDSAYLKDKVIEIECNFLS